MGSADWFYLEEDCTYRISGWVKGSNGGQYPQVNIIYAENVQMANRNYVEHMLHIYTAFGEENDVPLYVGEWGMHCSSYAFGSEAYIKDICELFEEYGLGSNYHAYHDESFGLYQYGEWEIPEKRNEQLYSLLVTWYGKPAVMPSFGEVTLVDGVITATRINPAAGTVFAALYDGEGRFWTQDSKDIDGTESSVIPSLNRTDLPEDGYIKLFLLDSERWIPLCPVKTEKV